MNPEIPRWGCSDLGFDAIGDWSNKFLSLEDLWVFRVDESDNGQFDDTDQNDDDVFFVEVPIYTDVYYEPYNLCYH